MKTAQEYVESMRAFNPRIFLGGKQVKLMKNPTTLTVIQANARVYELAQDPAYREIMTAVSPYTGRRISRCLHICAWPSSSRTGARACTGRAPGTAPAPPRRKKWSSTR